MLGVILVAIRRAIRLFILFLWRILRISRKNNVPGPPHHMLWGNIPELTSNKAHLLLTDWAKLYGDLYTIKVLRKDVYVLSSAETIHEALVSCGRGMDVSARPPSFRWNYALYDGQNIDMSSNWQYLRKVATMALKKHGEGSIEEITENIIQDMIDRFQESIGRPYDPLLDVETAVYNIILAMLTGHKFSHTYEEVDKLKEITRCYQECLSPGKGIELDVFPWLRFLPNKTYKQLQKAVKFRNNLTEKYVHQAEESFDGSTPRGMIDTLYMTHLSDVDDNGMPRLSDVNVKAVTFDMIVAGTETTSTSMYVFLLLMINHPNVQSRIQYEIDSVVGRERLPSLQDRPQMPYLEATLLEAMRYASIVPLANPHYTINDVTVGGQTIPKDSDVIINLWSVHHDHRYWDDPWMFDPDRFLDNEGCLLPPDHQRRKWLMPFGVGRRICVGETLAKKRTFQLSAALLQRFSFSPVDGATVPSADPSHYEDGVAICPSNFQLTVQAR